MAKYTIVDGRYQIPLIEFGNQAIASGWDVSEHPAFGGVTPDVHQKGGHHDYDEALDIHWDRANGNFGPDGKTPWAEYQSQVGNYLQGIATQVLHKGNDPDHSTHIHIGATGGMVGLTPEQYKWWGFDPMDIPTDSALSVTDTPTIETNTSRETAKERAARYLIMNNVQLDSEYDTLRAGDQTLAEDAGMAMHKSNFNINE